MKPSRGPLGSLDEWEEFVLERYPEGGEGARQCGKEFGRYEGVVGAWVGAGAGAVAGAVAGAAGVVGVTDTAVATSSSPPPQAAIKATTAPAIRTV